MARDPGDRLRTAQRLTVLDTPRSFSNQIGSSDRRDLLRLTLGRRGSLNLELTGLRANADLALLDSQGKVLLQSRRSGKQSESIVSPLNAGTYFVQITPASRRESTRYRLTFSVTNTVPQLTAVPLNSRPGTASVINQTVLNTKDVEQQANEIIYTLTNLPQNGKLSLNGIEMPLGGQFSQSDIDNNRLSYTSLGRIARLTADASNDTAVGISGSNVIWNKVEGQTARAFFYNGQTEQPTQLTASGIISAAALGVSGSKAVWVGFNGANTQVFLFDANTGTSSKITDDALNKTAAAISGENVAWNTFDGQTSRAFFYNGQTKQTTEITRPDVPGAIAYGLDGSKVVWLSVKGTSSEVFLYDATTGSSSQLTDTPANEYLAFVSGSNVAWVRLEGQINRSFLYNGQTGQTIEITSPGITSASISGISGSNAIWTGFDGTDNEVFFYNGATGTSTQLTSNTTNDIGAGISGNNLVWLGSNGADSDVFFYDGSTITELSNDALNDGAAFISGANVAWAVLDGSDTEVVLRSFATSDRFNFTVSDGLGGVTSGSLNIAIG